MKNHFQKMLVGAACVGFYIAAPVKNLHAGPFLDWLLGRPILTYPAAPATTAAAVPVLAPTSVTTAAYAPTAVTTAAMPATGACPCPVTAQYAPVPATTCPTPCAPAATTSYLPVVAQPAQYFNPTVVGYSPTYRTSWYRVPVTFYRPVTAYTGVAAQPVTVMQPCNTQTWQVRRTPFLFHRPWLPATTTIPYATYAPVTQPAIPTVTAPAMTVPAVTAPAVTVQPSPTSNCPCPNAASVAPTLTTPYYPPSATMPSTTIPSTTIPSTNESGAHIPSYSDPVPPGSVPADQAPALQQIDPGTGGYPNSASFTNPGASSSASTQRVSPNGASSVYQVKPIPDPQLNRPASPARVTAPPLLNPRERTASRGAAQSPPVTRAVYKAAVPTSPAPQRQAPAPKKMWDDSGWHTAP